MSCGIKHVDWIRGGCVERWRTFSRLAVHLNTRRGTFPRWVDTNLCCETCGNIWNLLNAFDIISVFVFFRPKTNLRLSNMMRRKCRRQ